MNLYRKLIKPLDKVFGFSSINCNDNNSTFQQPKILKTDSKKRVALCLSGYFDSPKDGSSKGGDGYEYIKKQIILNNDVDIYIHSWDLINKNKIQDLYGSQIVSSFFEKQIDFRRVYENNGLNSCRAWGTPYYNIFSQFYSIQNAFNLLKNSNRKYDCVIRSRFDLGRINRDTSGPGRHNIYPVQCINFNPDYDMKNFYYAKWDYDLSEGPADMWFYSNQENMLNFCNIYDFLSKEVHVDNLEFKKFCSNNNGGIVNAIKAWKWFLINHGLWRLRFPLNSVWE